MAPIVSFFFGFGGRGVLRVGHNNIRGNEGRGWVGAGRLNGPHSFSHLRGHSGSFSMEVWASPLASFPSCGKGGSDA